MQNQLARIFNPCPRLSEVSRLRFIFDALHKDCYTIFGEVRRLRRAEEWHVLQIRASQAIRENNILYYFVLGVMDCLVSASWRILAMTVHSFNVRLTH
jgi:hypothetical protein